MLSNYPSTFLRGIPHKNNPFFDSFGKITGQIFRPNDNAQPNENGFYEVSINWEDNNTVESFTLYQTKTDGITYHYRGGVARILLEKIEEMKQDEEWKDSIGYCRDPTVENVNDGISENRYHGNLLLDKDQIDNKLSKKALLAQLRLTIIEVVAPI